MGLVREAGIEREAPKFAAKAVLAAVVCALTLAACSSSSTDADDADADSSSAKPASIQLGEDARGQCFTGALASHGLLSEAALRSIASRDGLSYATPRAALEAWPEASFGSAAADVSACRLVN